MAESKCTPSSTWSLPTSNSSPAGQFSTAMSSPAGSATSSLAFCWVRTHRMNSNSPGMDLIRRCYGVAIKADTFPAMHDDRSHLLTELRLPESMNLDAMSIADAVALMNAQDAKAVAAVAAERASLVRAVEAVVGF